MPPPTQMFARAAAYVSGESVRQRELAAGEAGVTLSATTGTEATSLGIAGEVGVERRGLRSAGRLAYVIGLSRREAGGSDTDETWGLQSITQGLEASFDGALSERTRGMIRSGTFWGVRDSQRLIAGVGLGSGTGTASGTPAEAGPPRGAPVGTEQRRITRVPYLREDAEVGLLHSTAAGVTHQVSFIGSALVYPDQETVRVSGERLFETYTAGPQYTLLWRLTPRDTLSGSVDALTTWFSSPSTADPETEPTENDSVPIEALSARLGWTRELSRRWTASGAFGAGWVEPLGEPARSAGGSGTLLGALGTAWGRGGWALRADAERAIDQSDVGAVFATTTLRAGARRNLTPELIAGLTAAASRYDVLTQVFSSQADLEGFAALTPGEAIGQRALELRARRAQEGYGLEGTADLTWQFWGFAGLTLAYAAERRLSDDPNRGDRQVHRGVLGLTLTSVETQRASAETLAGD